jgi:two-component system, NtrC family, sensor kinase
MQRRSANGPPVKGRRRKMPRKASAAHLSTDHPQEQLVERLRRERDEAIELQAASAGVLKIIGSSPRDMKPVFEAMLVNALRICDAKFGHILLYDGERFHATHLYDVPPSYRAFWNQHGPIRPSPKTGLGRLARAKQVVHIPDLKADPTYTERESLRVVTVDQAGARSFLAVPMLKENKLVGAIVIYRTEVRPFSDKQIELVKNFAAQAVIAMENARLVAETREALEQQTATAEVLRVINSSPGNLAPVFEAILEKAHGLCAVTYGSLQLYDGNEFRAVAVHGLSSAFAERLRRGYVPGPNHQSRRLMEGERFAQTPDIGEIDDPISRAAFEHSGIRTALFIPLRKEGRLIGQIVAARREVRPFNQKEIALLENFAAQAVIAMENARLFNETKESLQQQTATADVLKVISRSAFDLQSVLDTLVTSASTLCSADQGMLLLLEDGVLKPLSYFGPYADRFEFRRSLASVPHRGTISGRAVLDGHTAHVPDVLSDPEFTNNSWQQITGFRAMLAVPLMRQGQPIGAMALSRTKPGLFADRQIGLVTTFADQAVIAIENVRLFEQVQAKTRDLTEALQQQTATADVLKIISRSTFDLKAVLNTLVEAAARLCGADKAQILRPSEKANSFYSAASYGHSREYEEYFKTITIAPGREGVVGRVLLERSPVQITDVLADPEYHFAEAQRLGGFRTHLGVPLLREANPIGILVVSRVTVRPFDDKHIELLTTFADQAVIAVENARLLNELRESLERQTATADVLKVISRSAFDLKVVLGTLLRSAGRLCEADMGVIARRQEDVFYRTVAYGLPEDLRDLIADQPVELSRNSGSGRALLEGRVIQINDVEADAEYTHTSRDTGAFRTLVGVPMMREGVPVGVMTLMRKQVQPFTEKQIELVSTFADQAAIAIENVRLFDAEQQRTRELTKSLEDLRKAQDRLVQTQKLASLGQLTAGIAHEIKNPLNFVNNFSGVSVELIDELRETLGRVTADDKTRAEIAELAKTLRDNLDKIVLHGKRADSIVKNMLLHSREGSGERRLIDVNALVEESLNLAYHGARAEKQVFNIALERSFDPGAGEIDASPQEITRVLLNLIANGFYAATKRHGQEAGNGFEPTIRAATKSLGDRVEIRIRDNGIGIPPEVREKMFNPFFTTKPAGEGTGLGLSISHDIIVKQHSGSIDVDTEPGAFTEFKIILPRTAE